MPGLPPRRYLFPVLLVCFFFSGAALSIGNHPVNFADPDCTFREDFTGLDFGASEQVYGVNNRMTGPFIEMFTAYILTECVFLLLLFPTRLRVVPLWFAAW
jgi:hypothetical protein